MIGGNWVYGVGHGRNQGRRVQIITNVLFEVVGPLSYLNPGYAHGFAAAAAWGGQLSDQFHTKLPIVWRTNCGSGWVSKQPVSRQTAFDSFGLFCRYTHIMRFGCVVRFEGVSSFANKLPRDAYKSLNRAVLTAHSQAIQLLATEWPSAGGLEMRGS